MNSSLIRAKGAGTLPGLFQARVKQSPALRAYMTYDGAKKTWREVTWREIGEQAERFRAALQGLDLKKGDRVALLLPNGTDWVGFDMAALSLGLVVVPLYVRDSPFNIARILDHSGARLVLLDTPDRWEAIAASGAPRPVVEHVWVGGATSAPLPAPLRPLGEVLRNGGLPLTGAEARPDDLATLVYTSGTTGPPKGVMLTHAAILWNAEAVTKLIAPLQGDVFLSVLPLAHAFERTVGYYLPMMAGATVAYARSAELLSSDLLDVRPSVLLAVPLLYERISAAIQDRAARSLLARHLLALAAWAGWRRFQWAHGRSRWRAVLARMARPILGGAVAERVLTAFGGRLRVAVSGGARLPDETARFLVGLGLPLVEGYGLTEAAPVVTGTSVEDYLPGSVGRALDGAELRLSDEGELQLRSPGVMQGYWKDAERTAAAFEDGWLKTGDLAEVRDGRVFIRGRLGELVVLATGEKIDPEPIEAAILRDPLIEHACVVGDARPFAVAVLALNKSRWRALAEDLKVDASRLNADLVKSEISNRIARNLADFSRFSQIRNIHLVLEPWTIEQGLLTPTLKVKRHAVKSRYKDAIAALYGFPAAFS